MADYTEHYLTTGALPQSMVLSTPSAHVAPQRRELLARKAAQLEAHATAPQRVHFAPDMQLTELGMQFDVIVVDPPWAEVATSGEAIWTAQDLARLDVNGIGAYPGVLFLWCGSGGTYDGVHSHFDEACDLVATWWAKVQDVNERSGHGLVRRSKELCLLALRDHVWRDTSGHFVHANVDADVVIAPTTAGRAKPAAFYEVVERFCLGRRRLDVFGSTARNGWVTLDRFADASCVFDAQSYEAELVRTAANPETPFALGVDNDIEMLRPKAPQRLTKGTKTATKKKS
ncbi:hypothetical protein SPRG_10355 [Saprolegnia parasitica CBS 223.65]|uniref:Methyltransferase n=1 Tax=Saprolegnia parasitica (strain CBS 223.65) TaxID=695850 RepID=A0A067C5V8_SAPPC|nr:hypothetical protein SPRG_10355 [Saprolegnia parasitica CBS 223.65]KDO24540.1 hypothetical protein SPRG_10355 [Saprolegnia parasitica CBS 223.65]|eukprot:XP_012204801.1 hypothetical protein SPRG_10355 [Saprolegnia parasitica CBS 223.65]